MSPLMKGLIMFGFAMFCLAVGTVFGGAVVFATISWIKDHVSTTTIMGTKYFAISTDLILVSIKLGKEEVVE